MRKMINFIKDKCAYFLIGMFIIVLGLISLNTFLLIEGNKAKKKMHSAEQTAILLMKMGSENTVIFNNRLKELEKSIEEFTGMTDEKRVQYLRLKVAVDSALVNYFKGDIKGIERMIELINKPK